jgi:hypothetical protein
LISRLFRGIQKIYFLGESRAWGKRVGRQDYSSINDFDLLKFCSPTKNSRLFVEFTILVNQKFLAVIGCCKFQTIVPFGLYAARLRQALGKYRGELGEQSPPAEFGLFPRLE